MELWSSVVRGAIAIARGATRPLAAAACLAALLLGVDASADLRRVEAVGSFGIREGERARVIPRDEAIARARWEGVSRVALELIGESSADRGADSRSTSSSTGDPVIAPIDRRDGRSGASGSTGQPGSSPGDGSGADLDDGKRLASALGKDMLPYTRSYRILEDKGESPVMFREDPEIDTEYVVVVEVIVDVDRVSDALVRAGLLRPADDQGGGKVLTIELVGIARYEALERVVDVLRSDFGATRIETLEFAHERQLLSVEGPFGLQGLSDRLAGYRDPQLVLEPIGMDSERGRIRVMGRWYAPDDGARPPG